jgi:hypothetical protein
VLGPSSCKFIANRHGRIFRPNLADLHADKEVPRLVAGSHRLGSHEHAVLKDRVLVRPSIERGSPYLNSESASCQGRVNLCNDEPEYEYPYGIDKLRFWLEVKISTAVADA